MRQNLSETPLFLTTVDWLHWNAFVGDSATDRPRPSPPAHYDTLAEQPVSRRRADRNRYGAGPCDFGLGYATSQFNLLRNIGGSIGIAVTGTILQRRRQAMGTLLGDNISVYDPLTQSTLSQIKNGLIASGADAVTATERAYVILHGMLLRQASMVSFVMLFRLLGIIFLLMLPLVLIMRRPKGRTSPAGAH